MKKFSILLLCGAMVWLTACGSGARPAEESIASESSREEFESRLEDVAAPLDVIYFKKLDDSSIMVACYTEEGVERMGGDYFVAHVGDAKIYNARDEEITLDELIRGCTLQLEWPGMVMESYPAQISANVVRALQDEAMDGIPPEDDIPAIFGGPKWWEEETVLEVPDMGIQYWTELAAVTMRIAPHSGTWHYIEQEYDNEVSMGEENAMLDGRHPLDWTYDDNNTIKKADLMLSGSSLPISNAEAISDTQSITISPYPDTKTFTVTAYAVGEDSREGIPVPVSEGGNITLLDGDAVYVVEVSWDTERYQGSAVYGFLVTEDK